MSNTDPLQPPVRSAKGKESSGRGWPSRLSGYRGQIPRVAVPSFFTLMNLFSGFLAITQVHEGQYVYACYLIVLAGFFDLLDGMMARLSQGQSLFGVELDSLSDVISFGAAPSYLVYAFALSEYGVFGVIVSALPAMCAAVRLARFNVAFDGESKGSFSGLPAPIQAFTIVTVVLNTQADSWLLQNGLLDESMLFPLVFILSGLMVTNIDFEGAPKPSAAYLAAKPLVVTGYAIGVILIIALRELGLLIGLSAYLFTGIIRAIVRGIGAIRRRRSKLDAEPTKTS